MLRVPSEGLEPTISELGTRRRFQYDLEGLVLLEGLEPTADRLENDGPFQLGFRSERSSTGRDSNPSLRALQARAWPLGDRCRRGSGRRNRTLVARSKISRPTTGRPLNNCRAIEPPLGIEPNPLAYQASVPNRGHLGGRTQRCLSVRHGVPARRVEHSWDN